MDVWGDMHEALYKLDEFNDMLKDNALLERSTINSFAEDIRRNLQEGTIGLSDVNRAIKSLNTLIRDYDESINKGLDYEERLNLEADLYDIYDGLRNPAYINQLNIAEGNKRYNEQQAYNAKTNESLDQLNNSINDLRYMYDRDVSKHYRDARTMQEYKDNMKNYLDDIRNGRDADYDYTYNDNLGYIRRPRLIGSSNPYLENALKDYVMSEP